MKCTFYLRSPKSKNETLIIFSCYFNKEKKKFVYSTKKAILRLHWNFKNKCPNKVGKMVARNQAVISKTLREFEDAFYLVKARAELGEQNFDSKTLKDFFDKEFQRTIEVNSFFEVYDQFMDEKIKLKVWKKSTIKRYTNIKNLLTEFQDVKKYKLTFNKINKFFFIEFTDFCYEDKNHFTNTFSRNVGLFKTFMFWSIKNGFAFKNDFEDFKKTNTCTHTRRSFNLRSNKRTLSF